mmetsp:Transcript_54253/g.115779  ORF Transcript_54253/g.115779 Transcript_54253/m.115779 type:complete len:248 (-) Transcript_54253:6-749(-)
MADQMPTMMGPGSTEDYLGAELAGLNPDYQPARIVAPPSGRDRAARVVESGTIGGPGKISYRIQQYEDLARSFEVVKKGPNPSVDFRQILTTCYEAVGAEPAVGASVLANPTGTLLADGGFIWFAIGSDRKCVGCLALRKTTSQQGGANWEIVELCVLPESRHQGVGRLLVSSMLRQMDEAAGADERLWAQVPTSFPDGQQFLELHGFEEAQPASDLDLDELTAGAKRLRYTGEMVPRGERKPAENA